MGKKYNNMFKIRDTILCYFHTNFTNANTNFTNLDVDITFFLKNELSTSKLLMLRTPRFYTDSLPLCVKIVFRRISSDVHLFLRRKRKNK
jgi:hypothetical protein